MTLDKLDYLGLSKVHNFVFFAPPNPIVKLARVPIVWDSAFFSEFSGIFLVPLTKH